MVSSGGSASTRSMWIFCSFAYLFFLGAFTHIFGRSEAAGAGPLSLLFLPIASLIQLTAALLLCSPKRAAATVLLLKRNRALVVALAVILASTMWSIDPGITLRRALALVGTTAVGVLTYVEIGRSNLLRFFSINLALFAVGSVIVALAIPELGTHGFGKHVGDWRGLLSFKNQAAWVVVIFLLIWLGARMRRQVKVWKYPLLAIGLLLLFQTQSATGFAAFAFGIVTFGAISLYRRSPPFRPLIILAAGAMVLVLLWYYQALFAWALDALDRDESLTGRTSVWSSLWPLIESRFWFGSGYLAFWEHASDYFGSSSWMVGIGHAHNAYVEILLDMGMIGLLTQVGFLCITSWRLFSATARGDSDAATMLTVLLTLAVIGIAGALFFRPNAGIWVMITAFACYAADCRFVSTGVNGRLQEA